MHLYTWMTWYRSRTVTSSVDTVLQHLVMKMQYRHTRDAVLNIEAPSYDTGILYLVQWTVANSVDAVLQHLVMICLRQQAARPTAHTRNSLAATLLLRELIFETKKRTKNFLVWSHAWHYCHCWTSMLFSWNEWRSECISMAREIKNGQWKYSSCQIVNSFLFSKLKLWFPSLLHVQTVKPVVK